MPNPPSVDPHPTGDDLQPVAGGGLLHRRVFMRRGVVLVSALAAEPAPAPAAAAGPSADLAADEAAMPPSAQEPGGAFSEYGLPSVHEQRVIRRIGINYRQVSGNGAAWTPIDRLEGSLTPNGLHFVRNHSGVPEIDPAHHRLLVHGRVRQPLTFGIDTLLRYPMRSQQLFLECAGNSSAGWFEEPVERPVNLVHGLVSCSEWTGVPLAVLLDEAGIEPGANWVVATGADAGAMHISLPLDKALDDCLVALYQNGERLRPDNGYPVRLIVPGWKAVLSVKWLRSLQLGDQPAMARNETARYTELLPSGQARQFAFVMEAKSVITSPSHGQSLQGPNLYEIRGLAWSGRGRIRRVEVSADGGATWAVAALQEPVLPRCLTRFRAAWRWDGRPCVLQSRATDETGHVQPTRGALVAARGRQGFYHYNAIVSWEVDAHGYVSHVYA
ncbi:sulfite dehydrogenase [Methylibium sp.]|uniref:sulfite dehydrogenase n=1 Tax=Methylibium sp. TaxID=2067992 RepID=UPI003D0FA0E0